MGFDSTGEAGEHPVALGTTENTTFSMTVPVLANGIVMSPVPDAVCGTTLAELPVAVHEKLAPDTFDESCIFKGTPEQILGVL